MKRGLITIGTIGVLCAALVGCATSSSSKLAPIQIARQSKVVAIALTNGPWDTVVIGDSIVQQARIDDLCGRTLNAGVGGADAGQAADFFQKVLTFAHPRRVIVAVGANDALRATPPEVYSRNVSRIVESGKRAGAVVVVSEIAPVGDRFSAGLIDAQPKFARRGLGKTNERAAKLNAKLAHFGPLPMHTALANQSGSLPHQMTGDGVHLTPAGYKPWLTEMAKACRIS